MGDRIKLTYFDARGRAEISRLVLAHAKKPYEDVRLSHDDWPEFKKKTPLGSVPLLEIGGKIYTQSLAIATYLARENGLYGSNNLDGLMIDQIQQVREDFLVATGKMMFAKDNQAELKKKFEEEDLPRFMNFVCKVIKENPAKSGFLVGKNLSLADLVVYEGTQGLPTSDANVLDKYPEIKALRTKVEQTDGIKQYLAKRKETPY